MAVLYSEFQTKCMATYRFGHHGHTQTNGQDNGTQYRVRKIATRISAVKWPAWWIACRRKHLVAYSWVCDRSAVDSAENNVIRAINVVLSPSKIVLKEEFCFSWLSTDDSQLLGLILISSEANKWLTNCLHLRLQHDDDDDEVIHCSKPNTLKPL